MSLLAQLVNFALALVFWMILGRILLTLIIGSQPNFFMGVFHKATEPVYGVVRRLTGGRLGEGVIALLSLLLIIALRVALVPLLRE